MKILLATDSYAPLVNGVATSVMTLRDVLINMGHSVRVLALSPSTETKEMDDGTIYIGSVDMSMIYPDIRLRHIVKRSVINTLIEWKPDIIHTNTEFSTFYLSKTIAAMTGAPIVHTYHTDYEDYVRYIHLSEKVGEKFVKEYMKQISRSTDAFIAPSFKTADELKKYDIEKEINVIPTGIDIKALRVPVTEERKEELREKFNIKKDVPVIMFLGRLGKEKNIDETIDCLSKCLDLDFQFLIVGGGPYEEELRNRVAESELKDRTIFTGRVEHSDIGQFYALGDLFTCASRSETQGLTYIEALSSSLPVLAHKDRCLDGVIEEGKNGWIYETEEEFRTYFEAFLLNKDKWGEYKKNAFTCSDKFSKERFGERVFELYSEVIKNHKSKKISRTKRVYRKIVQRFPLV